MTHRRDFLAAGLAGAGLLALPSFARSKPRPQPLKILVMGGTGFLGPHFVEAARKAGHTLTLFNRGKTNPERFAGEGYRDVEQLHGDRKTDMKALEGERRWDAVLDTSAYLPADVTRAAKLLGPRVGQYLLVSTISVYAKTDTRTRTRPRRWRSWPIPPSPRSPAKPTAASRRCANAPPKPNCRAARPWCGRA